MKVPIVAILGAILGITLGEGAILGLTLNLAHRG